MNEVFKTFLSLSLSGSLLIIALFLFKPLLKEKVSKVWQYYIWLLVIARLLLPFAPANNLMAALFEQIEDTAIQSEAVPQPRSDSESIPETLPPDMVLPENDAPSGNPSDTKGVEPTKSVISSILDVVAESVQYIWTVWPVVALIMFIRKITIYQSFVRYIRAGCVEVSDMDVLEKFGETVEQSGVKVSVELCTNSLISSPLLIGFFRPCIVLPSTDMPNSDFKYTMQHELMHYKRHDMFYKWLVQVAICLHWFNPLIYIMGREINRACELSCDESLIKRLSAQEKLSYGDTLLNAMGAGGTYKNALASVTLSESKELLKERLEVIMNFKVKSKLAVSFSIIFTAFLFCGAALSGAYASLVNGTNNRADISPVGVTAQAGKAESGAKPSFTLNVSSAAVNVAATKDKVVSAAYDKDYYSVTIENKSGNWHVVIFAKDRNDMNNQKVRLYVPDIAYGNVKLEVDSSYFNCDAIKNANIVGNFDSSYVDITLPDDFSGSLKSEVNSGIVNITSMDDYANTKVSVKQGDSHGMTEVPKGFTKNGDTYNYTNGTQKNVIDVTATDSGIISIYNSEGVNVDPEGFVDRWVDDWVDDWSGDWSDDWADSVTDGWNNDSWVSNSNEGGYGFVTVNGDRYLDSSSAKLINTKQWSSTGVKELEAIYGTDGVTVLPGKTDEFILKEYLTQDGPSYHAKASATGGVLKIEGGERPIGVSYASRIELFVPASFKGTIKLTATSGKVGVKDLAVTKVIARVKSGSIELNNFKGASDCEASSGMVRIINSTINGKLKCSSGKIEMDVNGLLGDVDAKVSSGVVVANISDKLSFNINASVGTGNLTNSFSDKLDTKEKSLIGKWGTNPKNTITLRAGSGSVKIDKQ